MRRRIGNAVNIYISTDYIKTYHTHTIQHHRHFNKVYYTSSGGFAPSTSASSFISIGIGIDALLLVPAFATLFNLRRLDTVMVRLVACALLYAVSEGNFWLYLRLYHSSALHYA